MADRVSSLLTRTQRERVRTDFADVEQAKRRRDQRKIRSRVAAGVEDFELLVDYPDRQFELAFEDHSDELLEARLADAYLTVERCRAINDVDRDDLLERAQQRRRAVETDETPSLEALSIQTSEQRRQRVAADLAESYRPSRWKRLSDALLKIGLALIAFVSVLAVIVPEFTNGFGSVPGIVGAGVLAGGLGIVGLRAVKYDLLPAVLALADDPAGTVQSAWNRL
ncbi:ABC transporter permease [Halomicrobium mukohataei]|uniref:ABC transporter permease n=1 Tax=Halomicrobium mukohataei TaxID=57705 RepID=A0A847U9U8_9EURY|nr:ABC transporter permease [Halomicrobium mukohataei]NLV09296.1 ABC transporter permease [Halomicrobium mukohataei]